MSGKGVEGYRKYRQNIVWGSIAFLFGLFCVILLVLSSAGYIPPIPVDPEHPSYLSTATFGVSSILIMIAGFYLLARGYKLRKFRKFRPPTSVKPFRLKIKRIRVAHAILEIISVGSGFFSLYGFFDAYLEKEPVGINVIAYLIVFLVSLLLMYVVEKGLFKWFRSLDYSYG